MSRNHLILAALSLLGLASYAPTAWADDPPVCDIVLRNCPPKSFGIVELPDATKPVTLAPNEAFVLYHECRTSTRGLTCTGWPQSQDKASTLTYQWTFEGAERHLVHNTGPQSEQTVECVSGEEVIATLTITNGKYRATSSETYTCGKH